MTITRADELIRLADLHYPMTLEEVRQNNPLCTFGDSLEEEDALSLGYALLHDVERPVGDVVVEETPIEVDGRWQRVYTARPFTARELEDRLQTQKILFITQLESQRDAELAVGFPYTLSGVEIHVQLRLVDRVNLIALKGEADYYINSGSPDQLMEFRPFENISEWITATQMQAMTLAALGSMKMLYDKVWAIKDQVEKATTLDEFPEMPDHFFG